MSSFFGGKKTDEKTETGSVLSIIAPGLVLNGDLQSEGDIRVEGKIIGNLICKSRVVIGPQGIIEGTVDSVNATVAGTIVGTLTVRDTLQLLETAKIQGDIVTDKMVVQAGALFTGKCAMGKEAKELLSKSKNIEIKPKDNG